MKFDDKKELYYYDPEALGGMRLDETIDVLKEFRENLPKKLSLKGMNEGDISFIQAILNVVDYIEVPQYINDEGSAEA
tara:strand:+ start:2570 stop:2803 length:234 start_codon:yes stop_codon:yes gene_type:complete